PTHSTAPQHGDRLPEPRARLRRGQARNRSMDLALGRRRSHHVAIVILVILAWAAAAHAEDAPDAPAAAQAQDVPRAPAATRSLADIPFQLVLLRCHLLGDWLGSRPWLADHRDYHSCTFFPRARCNT